MIDRISVEPEHLDRGDMKKGGLLLSTTSANGNKDGRWDGRCVDPSLVMFRKAVDYALAKGLSWDFMPELRSENGIMHAIRPSGKKLRLEDATGWEQLSGYAKLVDELMAMEGIQRRPVVEENPYRPKEAART